ncbi:MAG: recombinase family protein [bacterium]|nr:recombinase family protein [bacterium]
MKVALYARVSSEKQAENDLSISAQLKALRKHAEKNGWTIYKEFIDEAESALSANRPAFQEMIATAKKKEPPFQMILIWKFSRFARNREDSIIYKSLLRKHGVTVVSMNEQVDDSPAGKLLEGIIEVIDEFYSMNLAEDTIRGLRENANRGFQNGSIPVGYKAKKVMDGTNERTKLEPDETFAPIVQRIFDLCTRGNGIKEIANILNREGLKTNKGKAWSNSTVQYILKNEAYTGTLVYGKKSSSKLRTNGKHEAIRLEDNHPALVNRETYLYALELMSKRSPKVAHPQTLISEYLLSGLIECGKCGAKMFGSKAKSGKFSYYACHNYVKRGKTVCNAKLINKKKIEALVIERLKTHILTEENLMELMNMVLDEMNANKKDSQQQLDTIEKQLEALRGKQGKLYNSLETGKLDVDDLAPRIKEIKAQIDTLETKRNEVIEEIQAPSSLPFNAKNLKDYVQDLADLLSKGSIVEQKSFLRSFIERIVVNHPEAEVFYNIPIINNKGRTSKSEVLPMLQIGSPGWTRTSDLMVNSHPLSKLLLLPSVKGLVISANLSCFNHWL